MRTYCIEKESLFSALGDLNGKEIQKHKDYVHAYVYV